VKSNAATNDKDNFLAQACYSPKEVGEVLGISYRSFFFKQYYYGIFRNVILNQRRFLKLYALYILTLTVGNANGSTIVNNTKKKSRIIKLLKKSFKFKKSNFNSPTRY
jgi:hypothetical protein